jgi:hypothetical protein
MLRLITLFVLLGLVGANNGGYINGGYSGWVALGLGLAFIGWGWVYMTYENIMYELGTNLPRVYGEYGSVVGKCWNSQPPLA